MPAGPTTKLKVNNELRFGDQTANTARCNFGIRYIRVGILMGSLTVGYVNRGTRREGLPEEPFGSTKVLIAHLCGGACVTRVGIIRATTAMKVLRCLVAATMKNRL
jgi:hypothetical protein